MSYQSYALVAGRGKQLLSCVVVCIVAGWDRWLLLLLVAPCFLALQQYLQYSNVLVLMYTAYSLARFADLCVL